VPPIRNRIDMLATGIKSPVGVKVSGASLEVVDRIAAAVEGAVKQVPGVSSAFAERLTGGRYIDVQIDRDNAARFGLTSRMCRVSSRQPSAVTQSARRSRACRDFRSTSLPAGTA